MRRQQATDSTRQTSEKRDSGERRSRRHEIGGERQEKAETKALAGRKSCRESRKRQAEQRARRKAEESEREALSQERDLEPCERQGRRR